MLKVKYLHRKCRKSTKHYSWENKKYYNTKNADLLYDDLPKHSGFKGAWRNYAYDLKPLDEFIESKIGENWNDVYSEILTKIKKKYRQPIDDSLKYYVTRQVIYDEDFIPRTSTGRMLYDEIFIDLNNIIVKKTKEEILLEAKQLRRKRKLLEIIENQEKEKSNENNENESEDL